MDRKNLDIIIISLGKSIEKMGLEVINSLEKSLQALQENDLELAKEVAQHDEIIDKLCLEVEQECAKIIATEQPVAGDLRKVISYFQISTELERIGDHTKFFWQVIRDLSDKVRNIIITPVTEMVEKGIAMLRDSITALLDHNELQAMNIARQDDEIDKMHYQLYDTLIEFLKNTSASHVEEGTKVLFLNRFLERIGDHIANVCEWIIYAKTGNRVELN